MSDEKSPKDLMAMLSSVMEQARSVQGRIKTAQEKVAGKTVEGSAGAGMVKVTATGNGRIERVRIDPTVFEGSDREMLEDLVAAAVNDALRQAREIVEAEMGSVTSGMDFGAIAAMTGKK